MFSVCLEGKPVGLLMRLWLWLKAGLSEVGDGVEGEAGGDGSCMVEGEVGEAGGEGDAGGVVWEEAGPCA